MGRNLFIVMAALFLSAFGAIADEGLDARIDAATGQLDQHIRSLMDETGVPGLAIAVVRDGNVIFSNGYGVRNLETGEPVTPDTVFQLASVSKPIGASVVASVVGDELIGWDTRIRDVFPWFRLGDSWISNNVTVGDLYAHRSGLPDHAGDDVEQFDYSQRDVFEALVHLPLGAFRQQYSYTNYGLTLAAEAAAVRAGTDWASLSSQRLYEPLGMSSTSSRFADFKGRDNKAVGHVWENGGYVVGPERTGEGQSHWSSAYAPDRSSPAAGVSSSVSDMARWMGFMLAGGTAEGISIPASALAPMLTPKVTISEPPVVGGAASHYGYGMMITTTAPGHIVWTHSGAFSWGTGTSFSLLPEAGVGIVVLVNATPNGVAETIATQFKDIVLTGAPTQDWWSIYKAGFAPVTEPQGRLAKLDAPENPRAPQAVSAYAGIYHNPYYGALVIEPADDDALLLRFGPEGSVTFNAAHWDADTFVFAPFNDAQLLGSLSAVDFFADRVRIEAYDGEGLGTFIRRAD